MPHLTTSGISHSLRFTHALSLLCKIGKERSCGEDGMGQIHPRGKALKFAARIEYLDF